MITKEEFLNFIEEYQSFDKHIKRLEKALDCQLWETSWCNSVGKMFDIFLQSHFTDYGCDIICYQLFEAEKGQKIIEDDGEEIILETMEDVWNYLTDKKRIDDYVKSN